MKKLLCLILAFVMALSLGLVACGGNDNGKLPDGGISRDADDGKTDNGGSQEQGDGQGSGDGQADDNGQNPDDNGQADDNGQNPDDNGQADDNGQNPDDNGQADDNGQNPDDNGQDEEKPPVKSGKFYFTLNGDEYTVTADVSLISTKVTIPSGFDGKPVTGIGANAFENAEELICVIIPSSVKEVGANAFNKCYELKYVLCSGSAADFAEMVCYDFSILSKIYFYSETKPTADGNFWTYNKGEICLWKGGDAPYSIDAEIAPFGGIIGT